MGISSFVGRSRAERVEPAAIELLGGTPPLVVRRRSSPVRFVLPPALSRRIGAFDRAADRSFGHLRGRPVPDRIFYAASALGDFSLIWHLAGTARALRSPQDEREALRLAAALAVESAVINWGVKSLFRRARPAWEQHRPLGLRRPRSSSFPSGHATSSFLAATLLSDGGRRRSAPLWYALAAVTAASRVHVRIHHGSDVVAGALIGFAMGTVVRARWPIPTPPAAPHTPDPGRGGLHP
jgi:undecaprenyl-diphosphatase